MLGINYYYVETVGHGLRTSEFLLGQRDRSHLLLSLGSGK